MSKKIQVMTPACFGNYSAEAAECQSCLVKTGCMAKRPEAAVHDQKPKFKIVAVSRTAADHQVHPIKVYARKLEKALNFLVFEGYEITNIRDEPDGIIVLGEMKEKPSSTGLLDLLLGPMEGVALKQPSMSPPQSSKSPGLISQAIEANRVGMSDDKFVKKVVESLRGSSANELNRVADDFSMVADNHDKGHADDGCTFPALLRKVATSLREQAKAQIC